jgi:hypothetical protein
LVTRAPALATIGPHTPGTAAAVAAAACELAAREGLSPGASRRLRGRLARLQARDRAGRSSSGRRRDTVTAYFLISAVLNPTRAMQAGPARDRVLLGALDDALTALSGVPGGAIEDLPAQPRARSPAP